MFGGIFMDYFQKKLFQVRSALCALLKHCRKLTSLLDLNSYMKMFIQHSICVNDNSKTSNPSSLCYYFTIGLRSSYLNSLSDCLSGSCGARIHENRHDFFPFLEFACWEKNLDFPHDITIFVTWDKFWVWGTPTPPVHNLVRMQVSPPTHCNLLY